MWLEPEMSFMTDYESFSSEKVSRYDIRLYQNSKVYCIDKHSLMDLYLTYHEWAIVGVFIKEEHFIHLLKLRTTINFNDATENYKLVKQYFTQYLDVVPLKHLASWLNISPVHLSRIRAGN